jgi:hypothetical protein
MISLNEVQAIDLSHYMGRHVSTEITWSEFKDVAGREHYKLLAYLSFQFSNRIILDIGTHKGASSLALSYNPTNTIYSFDIQHLYPLPQVDKINYHRENLWDPSTRDRWESIILESAFIFMDIDPHEGTRELEFYQWLRDKNYQGFIVTDDIWYFKEMRDNFWYKIPSEHKIDVTEMGHWSGTGIIRFTPSEMWPARTVPTNWTVVTAYFDLTKMPDASPGIKERPLEHYLQSAKSTLSLDQNLVVFCEPENEAVLRGMRPAFLADKTKYVTMSFEEFPLTKFRDIIIKNRITNPYRFDERNTASYYLMCMARYAMLKKTISENPFGSTHFAWLNICIERMGYTNLIELDNVFLQGRDKFSTCYINYRPRWLVENPAEYYRYGGLCSMCSGFFTGNAMYMARFCDLIEESFMWYLNQGYGHADEQLFSAVYFKEPEIFEFYYGDYKEMIRNYVWVKERPDSPIHLFISSSFAHGDYGACIKGCLILWRSYKKGYATLGIGELDKLIRIYRVCLVKLGRPNEIE